MKEDGEPQPLPRLGKPHLLALQMRDFLPVLSSKARWTAHSGMLGVHELLLAVKWAATSGAAPSVVYAESCANSLHTSWHAIAFALGVRAKR